MDNMKQKILVSLVLSILIFLSPPTFSQSPVIKDLQKTKSNFFKVINVNGGEQDLLAKALDADSFPTFIIYKKGKEVWRKQGVVSKEELLRNLSKFGQ